MKLRRSLPSFLGVASVLTFSAIALGRAGGGEGFHGSGGGHGGGGGGGDGGGGALVFDIIFFCITHPGIGLPLILVIAIIFFVFRNANTNGPGTNFNPDSQLPAPPVGDPTGRLRAHDPAFDPNAFCNRVAAGFMKLQTAWCAQNLKDVRPFISDGIHERFSLQFAEQKAEGYRDQMDNIRIDRIVIADARSDDIYDELSVQIYAQANDRKVSLRDSSPVGPATSDPFVEIWSFLRRRGSATTPGKPGLLEGNCPNCGAPIALNESANCSNCNALLRSGEYDWVLSEITQGSEWQSSNGSVPAGFQALRQRDPDVNVQSLEDRTSVIFWRKATADRVGKLDPLFKVTSPAYGEVYTTRLRPPPDSPRTYYGQCAVGSVDVVGFVAKPVVDLALIDIRWSGAKMAVQKDSTFRQLEAISPKHTLFVLMRNNTAKTEVAKGISSAHCPNCGAPESGGTTGSCEFCGTALNDGSNGWVLDNILNFDDRDAQELLMQARSALQG